MPAINLTTAAPVSYTHLINGSCRSICSACFGKMQENIATAQADIKAKPGNYVTGIVGALLGSLIGVIAWVLVYQLGYIAAIVGLIMAVCTIKGYQLLGGKLNIAGVIICVVIMIEMCIRDRSGIQQRRPGGCSMVSAGQYKIIRYCTGGQC